MTPSLTVVTPTLGRPSLSRMLASVVDQLEDGDHLIVVGDSTNGKTECAAEMVSDFQPGPLSYVECFHADSRYGNAQRQFALGLAAGRSSHVMFLDDDDRWVHGALDVIRERIGDDRTHAHIFKATWGPGHHWQGTLWADREVREANFGTCQVVLPNRPYLRTWMQGNDRGTVSDYQWLSAAIRECDGVCWWDDVVAVVRP